jgi:hypothetical protein
MMHTAVHHPKGLSEAILFHALLCASNDTILELHRAVAHALLCNDEAHTRIPRHDDVAADVTAALDHRVASASRGISHGYTTRRHGTLQGDHV